MSKKLKRPSLLYNSTDSVSAMSAVSGGYLSPINPYNSLFFLPSHTSFLSSSVFSSVSPESFPTIRNAQKILRSVVTDLITRQAVNFRWPRNFPRGRKSSGSLSRSWCQEGRDRGGGEGAEQGGAPLQREVRQTTFLVVLKVKVDELKILWCGGTEI